MWPTSVRTTAVVALAVVIGHPELSLTGCRDCQQEAFSFALIGDDPYYVEDIAKFQNLIADLNSQPLAFVVHVGDIKLSGYPTPTEPPAAISDCSRATYIQQRKLFEASQHPIVVLFGDNDWWDCPGSEEAREGLLKELRDVFITEGASLLGQDQIIQTTDRQGKLTSDTYCPAQTATCAANLTAYPEHALWVHKNVLFVALHVIGYGEAGRPAATCSEFNRRECAYKQWLAQAFERAKATSVDGMVILAHGSPLLNTSPKDRIGQGFNGFVNVLAHNLRELDKPVLLAHGDDHCFELDTPAILYNPDNQHRLVDTLDLRVLEVTTFGAPTPGSPCWSRAGWGNQEIPWIKVS